MDRTRCSMVAALLCAAVVAASARKGGAHDYRLGSITNGELPAPYSGAPDDAWNVIFRALFTRDVTLRLTDEYEQAGTLRPSSGIGFLRDQKVSEQVFLRRESGDRPIVPLYPSFFSTRGIDELVREPGYSAFVQALHEALNTSAARPPLERAMMQADLWAAYDVLFARHSAGGVSTASFDAQRAQLLPLLAKLIHKLALTPAEIRGLPDNYAAALPEDVPPLLRSNSGWIEVEWRPERKHDDDAGLRTVARVFLKPRTAPSDVSAFVNRFRNLDGRPLDVPRELEATALVTEQLLIASDGSIVRSPLITDIQIRRFILNAQGGFERTSAEELELSRQQLRLQPRSGGFVHEQDNFPAYLSAAGNDYRFASPAFGRQGPGLPVLGTLASRCASCHGPGVGGLFTFSQVFPTALPPAKVLASEQDPRAAFVAGQKHSREDFKALLASW